jgi:RNA polymerase sigma-70 factor (ECF subfamily)
VSTPESSLEAVMGPGAPGDERLPVEQAFRRYHGRLVSFLRQRMRNEEDAADVAQETYVRLMQSYERDLLPDTAATLIFRIATNVANDFSRRRKSHHATDHCSVDLVPLASGEPSQERRLHARQQLERLYDAIESLSPRCQQVFLLSRVDHMTYTQIARHCGISTSMVEKHITNALAALREKVGDAP